MHEAGLRAQPATEDATGVLLEPLPGRRTPSVVANRIRASGRAGDAEGAVPGGHENQPVDPLREGPGQLLSHGSAEAHPEDMGALDAHCIEDRAANSASRRTV